jgi:hypothetical protein
MDNNFLRREPWKAKYCINIGLPERDARNIEGMEALRIRKIRDIPNFHRHEHGCSGFDMMSRDGQIKETC